MSALKARKPAKRAPAAPKRDRLDPRHAAVLDLRLRGRSWRQIEAELGIGHETARRWSLLPKFQREAERRRAAVEAAELEERRALRAAAWAVFTQILEDDSGADLKLKLETAKTILDRTGAPAGSTLDVAVSGGQGMDKLKPEQLLAIAEGRATLDEQGRYRVLTDGA